MKIVKFNKTRRIGGFTVKRGFIGALHNGRLVAVCSGWCSGGRWFQNNCDGIPYADYNTAAAVYAPCHGKWVMTWVTPGDPESINSGKGAVAAEALRRDGKYLDFLVERKELRISQSRASVAEL